MKKEKFATKINARVLRDLRLYAKESKLAIADVVSVAVAEHLDNARVRPAFRAAVDEVIESNRPLLKLLAK